MGTLLISKIREEYPDRMMLVSAILLMFHENALNTRHGVRVIQCMSLTLWLASACHLTECKTGSGMTGLREPI